MNIHVRKITFASTRNSGSPFLSPKTQIFFFPKNPGNHLYDYELRGYMPTNVAYMTTNVACMSTNVAYMTNNVKPRLRMCSRNVRMSPFFWITCFFQNFQVHPNFSNVPFFRVFILFQESWVPPNFYFFRFFPSCHVFPGVLSTPKIYFCKEHVFSEFAGTHEFLKCPVFSRISRFSCLSGTPRYPRFFSK